jgi:hypothetical protein
MGVHQWFIRGNTKQLKEHVLTSRALDILAIVDAF